MAIYKIQATWSGFPGAPGYSSFYFSDQAGGSTAAEARLAVHTFFDTMKIALSGSTLINVSPTVELYDETTGALIDYEDDDQDLGVIQGSASGGIVGPAGAVVNWLTATVVNGRRLRGRTFLVPLAASSFESDGTLSGSRLNTLSNAAAVLSGDGFATNFGVWSKPRNGQPGAFGSVTAHRIPDMAAVLRSRRD